MKVLLICDDIWHPEEIIQRGLDSMELEDLTFDIVKTAKDILTPKYLERYPVVIIAKGNAINAANSSPWFEPSVTECGPEEFRDYVLNGGGLLALHAALSVAFNALPVYSELIGAYYLSHPPREAVTVKVTADHPITNGVETFTERDELYQIGITALDATAFLSSTSKYGGTFTSGFARDYGKGRIATLAPGHNLCVWENPNFQKLFKNAIRWCARADSNQ